MEIRFSKKRDKHIISCTRDDGSQTWMESDDFYVYHDMLHYAVESTLGFTNAFFGMIASGISLSDFEMPKGKRGFNYSEEALVAESIVNLVALERVIGQYEDFNKALAESHSKIKHSTSVPSVSKENLDIIKELYESLVTEWKNLGINEAIKLEFNNVSTNII